MNINYCTLPRLVTVMQAEVVYSAAAPLAVVPYTLLVRCTSVVPHDSGADE